MRRPGWRERSGKLEDKIDQVSLCKDGLALIILCFPYVKLGATKPVLATSLNESVSLTFPHFDGNIFTLTFQLAVEKARLYYGATCIPTTLIYY